MMKTALFAVKQNDSCPGCGANLVIRHGRYGSFLGCSRYPDCQYMRPLKAQSHGQVVKILEGQNCPVCQKTLALRQGRYGMFIACSDYPQCNHTELIDKPDETSIECPNCKQGKLVARKSRYGKTFYACDRYPQCHFALNFKPVIGECIYCHYPLLMEKRTSKGVYTINCANKQCGKTVPITES